MNKIKLLPLAALFTLLLLVGCSPSYVSVKNDPTSTQIYTLSNGLKVYMSVSNDQPRIQTLIGVKVGAKNDPSTSTGLAHYFEHLMFKGTTNFGTINYEAERPILDQIEAKFEEYRTIADPFEKSRIYFTIDSLSYEASKYSVPNEYDKLMSSIGAKGTNASTSYDATIYTEDIPSNQLDNWAKIQADRFKNSVIRGFHTELETVYEEKNMSLTSDIRKSLAKITSSLYPSHPYGKQTILGTQDDLKNPSIYNIKEYYKKWYVPNNIAISLSGDFDPKVALETIERYFGDMKPNKELPKLKFEKEKEITEPIISEVWGNESESVMLGFSFEGAGSDDLLMLELIDALMNNGKAGLIDVNIEQKQELLSAWSSVYGLTDYTTFLLNGMAKSGQSLDDVKDILLSQIELLKNGDFDSSQLTSAINNYKLMETRQLDSYSYVAQAHINSFVNGVEWKDVVGKLDRMAKITKDDVVKFANEHFGSNYAVVYKRQGEDNSVQEISKPQITPILTNRDTSSLFFQEIAAVEVAQIEPHFVDFQKEMSVGGIDDGFGLLYKQNIHNNLFDLLFVIDYGTQDNPLLPTALRYFDYLGTPTLTQSEIKTKFYDLACDYSLSSSYDKTYITLSGLDENMVEALGLLNTIIDEVVGSEDVLANLKGDILRQREVNKSNQGACFSALQSYTIRGAEFVKETTLSNRQIQDVQSPILIDALKAIKSHTTEVLYYGPRSVKNMVAALKSGYKVDRVLTSGKMEKPPYVVTNSNKMFVAPYDAAQIYFMQYSCDNETFDVSREAINSLYNSYFGGGMNGIVFQEMREARALAYTASAYIASPSSKQQPYLSIAFIATQNDKMKDAVSQFETIINNMPLSEQAFNIAKESLLSEIRNNRTVKKGVLNSFLAARELGLDYDINRDLYSQIQSLTLDDVVDYQQKFMKNKPWHYAILGNESKIDIKSLNFKGKIQKLTLEDIFGY